MPAEDSASNLDLKALYSEYQKNGFLKIENFLTPDDVDEMNQELEKIVNNLPDDKTHVFASLEPNDNKENSDHYINSVDKINFFYEKEAFDENGKLLVEKKDALSKIAYALHWWNPTFKKYTFNQKIKDLLYSFEYKDPVVVQSMIIFKKPKIGQVYRPHQDATFLYSEPSTCIGFWIPLEDATEERGCLWFVPGSHKHGVHQRFFRNPKQEPRFIFEGEVPDYKDEEFVSVPAKKGDCVLIHGSVIHKSGKNTTDKARTVYTIHAVEKEAHWSEGNTLQPTELLQFPSLYSN